MKNSKNGISAPRLAMMALGTVIGGSFFLGSTVAVKSAGPGVVVSYVLGGLLVYIILFALSELTVADAAPGSFRTFAERAYGPGAGFVVGWVYWTGLVLAMSSEAIALSVFLQEWISVPLPVMGGIIIVIVTLLNLLGADKLSRMESGLAFVKLFAIVGFVVLGLMIILGLMPGAARVGFGALKNEMFFPGGAGGIAGSMLIVMFAYAGFEIIGLAASEAGDPHKTVPRAISYTVISLASLYILTVAVLLPLIPTDSLMGDQSPMVLALKVWNIGWAGGAMNVVLITAVLSTMLASMFGLGRMMRSLADEGHAPAWLRDRANIPRKGILFSGAAILAGLLFGFILPEQVYLFLVSSGGFSLLFTYVVILLTHYRFRKKNGCPPVGNCQLKGFPYTSIAAIAVLIAVIVFMPLVPGQGYGLIAGVSLLVLYTVIYLIKKARLKKKR